MKSLLLIVSILLFSCNKVSKQENKTIKEYTYNYQKDTINADDISNYLENDKYQIENYI